MGDYLRCVRRSNGTNAPECRSMAKNYLKCRMDKYIVLCPSSGGID